MSTLDEITNEKQRITEALARVDAQREKLEESPLFARLKEQGKVSSNPAAESFNRI